MIDKNIIGMINAPLVVNVIRMYVTVKKRKEKHWPGRHAN